MEYEGHLASSSTSSSSSQGTTITEANSFLLNQVTLLKPKLVPPGSHDPTALLHVTVPLGSHDPTALSHDVT